MPSASNLEYGEIAVNYHDGVEKLFIKNDYNQIVSFPTDEQVTASLNEKQDVINDLSTIRSGAALGATAVQTETDPTVPSWAKASTKPTYTASEVGLGNVGNFKAVSTVANQGLSSTEQSNARANIGAGTSSFSGNYNDLTNKPTIPTVNNATLTIQKNGTTVNTFKANADSNVTANITVPTKVSELTNDAGYTTNLGTVTSVKVGSTSYSPSSGVVSLPAYPTSLPASNTTDTISSGNSNPVSSGAVYAAIGNIETILATI